MSRMIGGAVVGLVAVLTVAVSAGLRLQAQDAAKGSEPQSATARDSMKTSKPAELAAERSSLLAQSPSSLSVQDALLRPFDLPFGEPTALAEVAQHLRRALHAPVVLDLGALERQGISSDDTVELDLKGVRLKTGLKLLLDQVNLTYRVEPEDNLLVLTDAQESDDRFEQVLDELRSLHRDLHALQDSVDELLDADDADKMEGAVLKIKQAAGAVRRAEMSRKVEY